MDAHVGEGGAEAGFHRGARASIQGRAAAAGGGDALGGVRADVAAFDADLLGILLALHGRIVAGLNLVVVLAFALHGRVVARLNLVVFLSAFALHRQVVLRLNFVLLGRRLALREQARHLCVANLTLQRQQRVLGCARIGAARVRLAAQRGLPFRRFVVLTSHLLTPLER